MGVGVKQGLCRFAFAFFCVNQGRASLAFSKPCLCLSDTLHFHHFRRSRGSEEWFKEVSPKSRW